jgi:hypothetical protein
MTIAIGIVVYLVIVLFTLGLVGATRRSQDRSPGTGELIIDLDGASTRTAMQLAKQRVHARGPFQR